jgi:hypothetical protein
MAKDNIRERALEWFHALYPEVEEGILTSKCYLKKESWSKSRVWFFGVPFQLLNPKQHRFLHFICENHLGGDEFIYLKVPVSFLLINEKSFESDQKKKVLRVYISAEAADMFKEVRKGSGLDLSKYVQNPQLSGRKN